MGHLLLLMYTEPLRSIELFLEVPVDFQKSLVAGRDREEKDRSSQGPWHRRAMDGLVPQFFFLLDIQYFWAFCQVGILLKLSLCHNKESRDEEHNPTYVWEPELCPLWFGWDKIHNTAKLSLFFKSHHDFFFGIKLHRALGSGNIWKW